MRDLTDLEKKIVEEGIRADVLLENQTFWAHYEKLRERITKAMVDTDPHEVKKREMLYYMLAGLKDIHQLLLATSQHRAQIEAEVKEDELLLKGQLTDNFE
jgi:hypothetical protein